MLQWDIVNKRFSTPVLEVQTIDSSLDDNFNRLHKDKILFFLNIGLALKEKQFF